MGKILLVGATGMVGSAVRRAADDAPLNLLARRAIDDLSPSQNIIVAESKDWPTAIGKLRPTIVLNALGTTIRQAGSQAAFRAVDHDLVLTVATAAKAAGAQHFISVSSVGASVRSGNFYLRTKGEVEAALGALAFERLDIVRPGLLTGPRQGPFRPGEALAMGAAPFTDLLLHGRLRRYRSVAAVTVAKAICALSTLGGQGQFVHEHDALIQLAD
jgi:uncharacterized protein YbjT (DUF2867 family)